MLKQHANARNFTFKLSALAVLLVLCLPTVALAQAQDARIIDNVLSIPVVVVGDRFFSVDLVIVADTDPAELELSNAVELSNTSVEGASTFDGSSLSIPSILLGEAGFRAELSLVSEVPVRFRLASAEPIGAASPPPPACTRPVSDRSQHLDKPPIIDRATVPLTGIVDGGPGPDGIPPVEAPIFIENSSASSLDPDELVIGVKIGNDIRAYPHRIMNWHEVLNDRFTIDGVVESATLSYCPLTGSAMLWQALMEPGDQTFGTSGLVYNSNLLLYDRQTFSLWSQMLEQSVLGPQIQRIPDRLQVVETSWQTWQGMYPETSLLSERTGYSRDYDVYPYGSFRVDRTLLYTVDNLNDLRLHRKDRVVGINVGSSSKVYPIKNFASDVEVINDTVGDMSVVAAGSSGLNFGVVFNRELEDCTVLDFDPIQNKLPIVMQDSEGNEWDIFGIAVSGERTGQQLEKTNSYIAYWYAWTAFFADAEINP